MPGYNGQLAADLSKYQNLGMQQGRQNLPPSNAETPDQSEIKLEADAKQYMLAENSAFLSAINGIDKQCTTLEHSVANTQSQCDAVLSDTGLTEEIAHHLASEQHMLVAHRAHQLKLQADLNGFRGENRINHQAHYPPDSLLHLSWIMRLM